MSEAVELVGFDKAFELIKGLPENTRKAASLAINDTLKEVQTTTGNTILPNAFTLRGRGKQWWEPGQKFGFNVKPYSNPESLTGTLGSQADWLKLQEFGGKKEVAGHRLAIPAPDYKPLGAIMSRDIKPRTILADFKKAQANLNAAQSALDAHRGTRLASAADKQRRHTLKQQLGDAKRAFRAADRAHRLQLASGSGSGNKAFIAEMKSGFMGIFKRVGASRNPLKLLFSLTRYAGITPHLAWEKTAQDLANERYDRKFAIRFMEAIK